MRIALVIGVLVAFVGIASAVGETPLSTPYVFQTARGVVPDTIPCDTDSDTDVDFDDYGLLHSCLNGPAERYAQRATCEPADQNLDRLMDLRDFAAFENCFSGEGMPGSQDCAVQPLWREPICDGGNAPVPNLNQGPDLHRMTLLAPGAICNDGSPAIMYIRRAANPAHATQWIIHLQSGGGCGDYDSCKARWCGTDGSYDASKMSSIVTHNTVTEGGIFNRSMTELAEANLVYFYYCSSDSWVGRRSNVPLVSNDPGQPPVLVHFRGHTIIEAGIATLMPGGATSDDGLEVLPPLSAATHVIFSGASAGSAGMRQNLDWLAGMFDPKKTRVVGVLDAGGAPLNEDLPDPAEAAATDAEVQDRYVGTERPLYDAFLDESCLAHLGGSETEWKCSDETYVSLNHITTPFFVRHDLTDSAQYNHYAPFGVDIDEFGTAAAITLARYRTLAFTAVEGADIPVTPGVYGPNCGRHITLAGDRYFFEATVEDESGTPWSFHELLVSWLQGNDAYVVDEHPAATSFCPP